METINNNIQSISLSSIHIGNINPRKHFPLDELNELAESIRQNGVLQAILVRPYSDGKYELVFGERRYRASIIAGAETIPATIREISDTEALEIALIENLNRKDLLPSEEASFYQMLLSSGKYEVADLSKQIGKSENYIRIRLKLNLLIDEFKDLLDKATINVSVAFELCKFPQEQQEEITKSYFSEGNNVNSWRGKTAKEIANYLQGRFTNKLDNYSFDKSECASCTFNSNNQSLFPIEDECGYCSDMSCLKNKNTSFLVNRAMQIQNANPQLVISKDKYVFDNDAIKQLETEGYSVKETGFLSSYPVLPTIPDKSTYDNDDEYSADMEDYYSTLSDYNEELSKLNELFSQKKLTMYACVGDKGISLKYEQTTMPTDPISDKFSELVTKDERNKEIKVEKIIADVKKEVEAADLSDKDFTLFEEHLLYFNMLSFLKKEHYKQVGITSTQYLTDELKINIIENLTEEIKTIIRRDFIVNGFKECFGTSARSSLFLQFAKLHASNKVEEIETTHDAVFQKRHTKIEEKKAAIQSEQAKDVDKVNSEAKDSPQHQVA